MDIETLFENKQNIPSVPQLVRELLESFSEQNATLADIGKKVSKDKKAAARVLQMVNSPLSGLSQKCKTIEESVVLLGTAKIKTLVITSGLIDALAETEGMDLKEFWAENFRVAAFARYIACKIDANPDIAFSAGLLHDFGNALVVLSHPEIAAKIAKKPREDDDRIAVEINLLGFSYAQASTALARHWELTDGICSAIEYYPAPLDSDVINREAAAIHLATILSSGMRQQLADAEQLKALPQDLLKKLDLTLDETVLDEAMSVDTGLNGMC